MRNVYSVGKRPFFVSNHLAKIESLRSDAILRMKTGTSIARRDARRR